MISRGRSGFNDVESETLLLVEGNDEVRFFNAFLNSLNIEQVQIASRLRQGQLCRFLEKLCCFVPGLSSFTSVGPGEGR